MPLEILALQPALPSNRVSQTDALKVAEILLEPEGKELEWLRQVYNGCAIGHRHFSVGPQVFADVLEGTEVSGSPFLPRSGKPFGPTTSERMEAYETFAGPLAIEAVRGALSQTEVPPETLRHLVTVSCTGFFAPGLDNVLINQVPLLNSIERTHVGFMGCHGAFNGLRAAHGLAMLVPGEPVLMVAAELCSLHNHYQWDREKLVANALFGDGAAAVVARYVPDASSRPQPGSLRLKASASCIIPNTADLMSWNIGDHGFNMTLSPRIPALVRRELVPWLSGWLATQGLTIADVKGWAVHPGGPRILDAVEDTLGMSQGGLVDSREILASVGNISSPTILFILDKMMKREQQLPIVALGFGPGIAIEAALFA